MPKILDIDNNSAPKEVIDFVNKSLCKNCDKKAGMNPVTFHRFSNGKVIWWHKNNVDLYCWRGFVHKKASEVWGYVVK